MIRKCLVLVAVLLFLGSLAFAEPQRMFFVKENRMPGANKVDLGAIGQFVEVPDDYVVGGDGYDYYTAAPYARYGLAENLAVYGEVPYVQISPNHGNNEEGLGDVVAGAELVLFQDLFSYPFIIPHVESSFGTGDEDKGLGYGKTLFTAGVSVGTVVMDMFHYVVDVSYTFNERSANHSDEEENVTTLGGAFIWDLNDQVSLLAEGKASTNRNAEDDVPMVFQGGFSYQITENICMSLLGGGAKNTDADVVVNGKVAYSF